MGIHYLLHIGTSYRKGFNKSNRKSVKLTNKEICNMQIYHGFHVFKFKKDAIEEKDCSDEFVFPVLIKPKNVVAVGIYGEAISIVCTKMKV